MGSSYTTLNYKLHKFSKEDYNHFKLLNINEDFNIQN